jgi:hypothetical protein
MADHDEQEPRDPDTEKREGGPIPLTVPPAGDGQGNDPQHWKGEDDED